MKNLIVAACVVLSVSFASGISGTVSLAATESATTAKQGTFSITFQNNVFDIEVEKIPLGLVLKELANKSGVQIQVLSLSIARQPVTLSVKRLPIEEALKRVLHGYSYAYYNEKGTSTVTVFPTTGKQSNFGVDSMSIQPGPSPFAQQEAVSQPLDNLDEFQRIHKEANSGLPNVVDESVDDLSTGTKEDEVLQAEKIDRAINALQSKYDNLHEQAINELVGFDRPEATAALIQAANGTLQINPETRVIAVNALWHHAADLQFNDDSSVVALKELANDKDNLVRDIARRALSDMVNYSRRNAGQ